jgi:2-polyprenyl-3-methyl-5-hydroxy-6-metoxy-1,4-benzoquinol methylase
MKNYQKKNCRLCDSKKLKEGVNFISTPAADSYISSKNKAKKLKKIPLKIMLCSSCGNSQLSHVINAKQVYLNYIYETASTLGLNNHFQACANTICKKYNPSKNSSVLDIGSNDGILLHYFKRKGFKVLGVDPMPGINNKAKKYGVKTEECFFSENEAKKLKKKYGTFEVITSNNLVADTDDLNDFVLGVRDLMNNSSIFFFETFYFYSQIKNFVWDFTYHEHYSYFTVGPLKKYFAKLGMEIIDLEKNETKGGSIRFVLQLKGGKRKVKSIVNKFIKNEKDLKINTLSGLKKYEKKITTSKKNFSNFLKSKNIPAMVGYGASATSTTLIYNYDLSSKLNYLVDDFKAKFNLYSPGEAIKVFDSKIIYKNSPDYILILAWRYAKKIIKKNIKFLKLGGKFVLPLPTPKIVTWNNYKKIIK